MPKYIIALMKFLVSSKGFDKARMKVEDIHFNISGGIIIFLGLIFIGSFFNFIGWMGLNLYLGLVINIITVIAMSSPEKLFKLGIAAIIFSENKKENGQKNEEYEKNITSVIEIYGKIISYFLIIASASFLFLGTFSIRYNPNIVPVIALCGVLMLWTDVAWKWKTKTFRKATGFLIIFSITLNILFLIPKPVYIYLFDAAPSDISVKKMEQKIEKEENRGVIIKGIKSLWGAGNDSVEKIRLEAEIARLRAAVEEVTKNASGSSKAASSSLPAGVTQDGDLVTVNEPCTFTFHVQPHQALSNRYKLGDDIYLHISTTKNGDNFHLQREDGSYSSVRGDKKGFEKPGIVRPVNGNNETTMTLHFTRDA